MLYERLVERNQLEADKRLTKTCKQTKCRLISASKFYGIFLLLASDIASNPGPCKPCYPCGTCKYAVSEKQRAILCDTCNFWTHLKCINAMTVQQYKVLGGSDDPWYCSTDCTQNFETRETEITQIYNFSDSFFNQPGTPL